MHRSIHCCASLQWHRYSYACSSASAVRAPPTGSGGTRAPLLPSLDASVASPWRDARMRASSSSLRDDLLRTITDDSLDAGLLNMRLADA